MCCVYNECENCGKIENSSFMEECIECGSNLCEACINICDYCGQPYCSNCLEGVVCSECHEEYLKDREDDEDEE